MKWPLLVRSIKKHLWTTTTTTSTKVVQFENSFKIECSDGKVSLSVNWNKDLRSQFWSCFFCCSFKSVLVRLLLWIYHTNMVLCHELHTFPPPMCINYPLSGFSLFLGHSLIHLSCLIFPGSVFSNLLTVDYCVYQSTWECVTDGGGSSNCWGHPHWQ